MRLGGKRMVVAGVFALGLIAAACSNYGGTNGGGGATTGAASSQPAASASAGGGGGGTVTCNQSAGQTSVTTSNFAFDPTKLSAKSCTTVSLDNKDSTTHTFTIDNSPINVTLPGGSKGSAELALAPGTYTFYCRFHGSPDGSGMAGTVTVT